MRPSLTCCLLLAFALPCRAQGPKPITLTPKEIADGWILLFDGETTFGWSSASEFTIGAGCLNIGGPEAARITTTSNYGVGFLEMECRWSGVDEPKLRYPIMGPGGGTIKDPFKRDSWRKEVWTKVSVNTRANGGYSLEMSPGFARVSGGPGGGAKKPIVVRSGPLAVETPAGTFVELRAAKHKPEDMKPLFNSKDLTGWNVFPKKKSQFEVVDGAIYVKDGPGDLQTVGTYKDFILQLECKSNGNHLNSGIFFRCRAGEYQNGYEAQIRNQFTDKPTQKYLIEDYDPKTNKLIDKKERFFSAVDYGTGAIYRRQPARKEMSKDGEWFTMTIVAQGNHFATWVNGVQVADWTDHRPASDNARTGCRLEGGHISIQGHDPTTDLSFRNLRIAELPAAK